jgi:hypothetical protein
MQGTVVFCGGCIAVGYQPNAIISRSFTLVSRSLAECKEGAGEYFLRFKFVGDVFMEETSEKPKSQADYKVKKKFKCVLVGMAGNNTAFSLSLYNLKAAAYSDAGLRHSWEIEVIQLPLLDMSNQSAVQSSVDDLLGVLSDASIHMVGFSAYLWNIDFFRIVAQQLAERDCSVVFGGPEISRDWIEQARYDDLCADFLVFGEGEKTFSELLQAYPEAPANSDGLAVRKNQGWLVGAPRAAAQSISEYPSPYLTGCVDDEVLRREDVQANIETQRGCTLRCSYCIYHKDMPKISYADLDRVVGEVLYCVNKGVKSIRFTDANFGSNADWAKAVVRALIKHRVESTLMFELIPGFLDEELADLFAEYNAMWEWNYISVGVGVQSINRDVLLTMRRGIRREKFDRTFELLTSRNIYAKIDIIIGLPGESLESITDTLEYMLTKLKGNEAHLLCCHLLRGLPGTELLTIAKEFELEFSSERDPHELVSSPVLPRKDLVHALRRAALTFRIINPGWGRPIVRRSFYNVAEKTGMNYVELLDYLTSRVVEDKRDIRFSDPDFPYAERWWWGDSQTDLADNDIVGWLQELQSA